MCTCKGHFALCCFDHNFFCYCFCPSLQIVSMVLRHFIVSAPLCCRHHEQMLAVKIVPNTHALTALMEFYAMVDDIRERDRKAAQQVFVWLYVCVCCLCVILFGHICMPWAAVFLLWSLRCSMACRTTLCCFVCVLITVAGSFLCAEWSSRHRGARAVRVLLRVRCGSRACCRWRWFRNVR